MKAIRLIQLAWAGLLVTLLLAGSLSAEVVTGGPFLALAVIYLLACILALGSSRLGWVAALVVPVIICARWLPMVALNVIAFAKDDPLYLDSPGTIYVVGIYALLFVFPALALVTLFWRHRTTLRALLIGATTRAA
jgi:hypothetical protein